VRGPPDDHSTAERAAAVRTRGCTAAAHGDLLVDSDELFDQDAGDRRRDIHLRVGRLNPHR
jgi:hypothetical protein